LFDKVIIATGSKAYPKTGSDGFGYDVADKFGHNINMVVPALTQLKANEKFLKDWENVRCDAKVTLFVDGQKLKEDIGEIQLTSSGISGICVFNISGLASKNISFGKTVEVEINFLPHLENDFYAWINNRANKMPDKTIEEILESIFNYKLMFVLLKQANISKDKKWNELNENSRKALCEKIQNFRLNIIDTESFDKAQVCAGGVSLNEINPSTLESSIVSNLYFAGEVLDVDGKCGGFNLAFAWISGYLAGRGA
jgi:predicted Rossmann fold flavoprotein